MQDVRPALDERGIRIVLWDDLPPEQQAPLHEYFRAQVFPVLTPLAVDPAHPFPYISGLSLNLAVLGARPGDRRRALRPGQGARTTSRASCRCRARA